MQQITTFIALLVVLLYICVVYYNILLIMDIKSIIKEKGYTIQDVAKKMGVNRVTLTLTLQGNPTYKKLKEIADAIDCDIVDFFRDEVSNLNTHQIKGEEFTALIHHKGEFYKATTIEELKKIVTKIDEKSY